MHKRDQQGRAHASTLPVVLDEHSDVGYFVAYIEIAKAHAFLSNPSNVRISTISLSQYFLAEENAVSDAVKATIESRR